MAREPQAVRAHLHLHAPTPGLGQQGRTAEDLRVNLGVDFAGARILFWDDHCKIFISVPMQSWSCRKVFMNSSLAWLHPGKLSFGSPISGNCRDLRGQLRQGRGMHLLGHAPHQHNNLLTGKICMALRPHTRRRDGHHLGQRVRLRLRPRRRACQHLLGLRAALGECRLGWALCLIL